MKRRHHNWNGVHFRYMRLFGTDTGEALECEFNFIENDNDDELPAQKIRQKRKMEHGKQRMRDAGLG